MISKICLFAYLQRCETMPTTPETPPWPIFTPDLQEYARAHIHETRQPEALTGLSPDPPLQNRGWEIVTGFDVTPPKDRARDLAPCCICKRDHKYYKGVVFWGDDGYLRLAGWQCWGKHFGNTEVKQRRRDFEKEQRRLHYLRQITTALPNLAPARREIIEISGAPCALKAIEFRDAFRTKFNPLFQQLLLMGSDHGNHLVVPVRRSSTFREAGGRESGLGPYSWASIGALVGVDGLDPYHTSIRRLETAARKMEYALDPLATSEVKSLPYSALQKMASSLPEAIKEAQAAREGIMDIYRFCEPENLTQVCRWANDPSQPFLSGHFEPLPRGICWTPQGRNPVSVQLVAYVRPPPPLQHAARVLHALQRND